MALVRWLPTCATEVPDASTARVVRLRRFRSGSCEFRSPRLRESGDIHVSHSPASDIVVGIDGRPRNVRRPVASRESAAAVHSCGRSEASPQKCARRLGYTDGPVSDCKAARLRAPDVRLQAPDFRLQASGFRLQARGAKWVAALPTPPWEALAILDVRPQACGPLQAGVAELADAPDSKSGSPHGECGFDSLLRHHEVNSLEAGARSRRHLVSMLG